MKVNFKNKPREYRLGSNDNITIKDWGTIYLESDEQITFLTEDNAEYDVCRKEWGYYATPSVNNRLKNFGFKTALVKNSKGQIYVMIVRVLKLLEFQKYLSEENNIVLQWLDEEPLN